jgi:hypothetical protein
MVFDDHEVTDDWNITQEWCENVVLPPPPGNDKKGSALGRRIVQNGLAAYAIFQAWGNTPAQFTPTADGSSPGAALLSALQRWDGGDGEACQEIARRVGLPTAIVAGVPQRPQGALTYHFHVTWPSFSPTGAGYQLIFLDTRTWRVFTGGPKDPPALLLGDGPFREMLEVPADLGPEAVTVVVSPAPVIGLPLLEEGIQVGYEKVSGPYGPDYEAWLFVEAALHKLLARLFTRAAKGADGVRRGRVVLLSGDVHYGFAASLRYSAKRPYHSGTDRTEGVAAQFVSSSLHNEASKTWVLHSVPGSARFPHGRLLGWENRSRAELAVAKEPVVGTVETVSGSPAIWEYLPDKRVLLEPEWLCDIRWLSHEHGEDAEPRSRGAEPVSSPSDSDWGQALRQFGSAAANQVCNLTHWGAGREVVGANNLGVLRFSWKATGERSASQTLWWRGLLGDSAPAARTRYVVNLGLSGSLYG